MFNFDRPDLVCGKMKRSKKRSILPVVVIIAVTAIVVIILKMKGVG